MSDTNSNIYKLKKNDIEKASLILANAFENDPVWKTLLIDFNLSQRQAFFESPVKYGLTFGNVYSPSKNIEGVIAITKSKNADMTFLRSIYCGSFISILKIGLNKGFNISKKILPLFRPLETDRKENMSSKEYYYIIILGVDPNYQGKGFGKKLIQYVNSLSDRDGIPVYLETSTEKNVIMYQKYGFKIIKEITLPIINLPQWEMIREI